jgi:hypothetical protein
MEFCLNPLIDLPDNAFHFRNVRRVRSKPAFAHRAEIP